MKDNIVLAIDFHGKKITVKDCENYLLNKDKALLAEFIYNRLYGRYLKVFNFKDKTFEKDYKNGFSIMANCCLLIETYISFINKDFRNTNKQSGKTFGYFFTNEVEFKKLSKGGINTKGEISTKKEGGTPNDFFENVRCGILHNGETRNGWLINRDSSKPYFNEITKEINASKFASKLDLTLKSYKEKLLISDFDKDDIWINFKNRLEDIIKTI